jgi:AcrR family transcriptional regulator
MTIMSNRQKTASDPKRVAILEAAKQAFSRYGLKRTSMADIAGLASVSRPALYLLFKDKDEIFRTLAAELSAAAAEAAEAAWPKGAPFAQGLEAAILAKDLAFFRLIHLSPHGAELLTAHPDLTGDIHAAMEARFASLVASRTGKGAAARTLGVALARAFDGLKHGAKTETDYLRSVAALARALSPP